MHTMTQLTGPTNKCLYLAIKPPHKAQKVQNKHASILAGIFVINLAFINFLKNPHQSHQALFQSEDCRHVIHTIGAENKYLS